MTLAESLAPELGLKAACELTGAPRATIYRRRRPPEKVDRPARVRPTRALTGPERAVVLETLNSERFADKAPAEVQATLLDEGVYLCSTRTMYRVLASESQVRERRDQLRHPNYTKPELLATRPNQVWSWDITKLRGPERGVIYSLYVILDIFSRYVVGWHVAGRECGRIAQDLFHQTLEKQQIARGQIKVHADRGPPMKSKALGLFLADLDLARSFSRPQVSNDNPFSESQFKTLKYRPEFPDRFGSVQDARAFCQRFFRWYNAEHRHSGIAMLTPEQLHTGKADEIVSKRDLVLKAAFNAHPERFVHGAPSARSAPAQAWINRPEIAPAQE